MVRTNSNLKNFCKRYRFKTSASLLFFALFLFPNFLFSKEANEFCPGAGTIEVSELVGKFELSRDLRYFSTNNETLSIESILHTGPSLKLIDPQGKIPNFGNSPLDYWFCFHLRNSSEFVTNTIVFVKYPLLDELNFYDVYSDGSYAKRIQGRLFPFSSREIKYRGFGHLLSLSPGETRTLFLRVETQSSMSVPLYVAKEKDFYEFAMEDFILQGIYFGIVGVMTLYNLFVFFLVKDKAYIFYVIYLIFSAILFQLSLNGHIPIFFLPNSPEIVWNAHNLLYFIFLFTTFPMSITFMNLKESSRTGYKALKTMMFIPLVCILLLPLLPYRLMNQVGDYFSMILALGASVVSYYVAFIKRFRPARFFFYAFLVVIIGGIASLLKYMGVLPVNSFTENAFQISMAIEVILMAFGLGDRISIVRKEKEKIQLKAEIDKQKIMAFQKELILAQKLQESTLPQVIPESEGLRTKAGYIPASLVGGDFYDITKAGMVHISCLIADVTGHGVPAAIEAAMLKIAYTQSIHYASSPGRMLERINQSLVGNYKNQFLTAAAVFIDLNQKTLKVANAGHPALYWLKRKEREIQAIRPKGKLIGFSKELVYPEEEYPLAIGDKILLFTDGLWEAWERNEAGDKAYTDGSGEKELLKWLDRRWGDSIDELFASMEDYIRKRNKTTSPEDDITFILFEMV
ncbi:7TM diverse intracellular signaling domain-containing protein [Leptospira idonii]|uniref:Serine/threonine protein phosphatase n=1 Tax=Leptospira idonii TaxID=1193500 RepID=A0A4R9LZF1_9LEPT|nr:7TM diverse intracellular signaling domain-containing protein [Leptospira idonii]TGN19804.1 serine/threonine protein phosphatase [Leptospira idonii]